LCYSNDPRRFVGAFCFVGSNWSPIYIATRNGHADAITQLVASRCDVNKCYDDLKSLIYIAAEYGRADCITQLVAARVEVNLCYRDQSPIQVAAKCGHHIIISQLREAGAR
jgi:hypothetical protein